MKKTIATMLYVTYLAFGVSAHAAQTPVSSDQVPAHKAAVKSDRKAQRAADRALSKKILHSLSRTKGLNAVNVSVLVRRGVVTLSGYVPDSEQVQIAGESAGRV
jgi:hyperosmotically inducible periplasmic protein